MRILAICVAVTSCAGIAERSAAADARPLPFSHSTDVVIPGELRVTTIVDLVPLPTAIGESEMILVPAFQTELEVGVTDRLEVAIGLTMVPTRPYPQRFEDVGNGLRQRAKYVLVQPGDWWFDLAAVAEISERDRAIEFEGRAVLRAVVDRLRLVANAGSEYALSWVGDDDVVLVSSLATTYEIAPQVIVGAEGWLRSRYPDVQVYAGPVVQLTLPKLWITVGAYVRPTEYLEPIAVGDTFGRYWFRTLVGFDL